MGNALTSANRAYDKGFARLGLCLGHRPGLALALTVLCCMGLAIGLVNMKLDTDILGSFVPYGSRWRKEEAFVDDDYSDRSSRTEYIQAYDKNGGSVLTAKHLKEWLEINKALQTISVTVDGVTYKRENICSRTITPPLLAGVLDSAVHTNVLANWGREERLVGLPCSRYSTVDCFYEGGFDYWNGRWINGFSAMYFPYIKDDNTTRDYAILTMSPLASVGVPNSFLTINATGTFPGKPVLADVYTDAQVRNTLKPSCTVWAGVRLPPDIIMGGRVVDPTTGDLVSAKGFLMAFFVQGVSAFAKEMQFRDCSRTCRAVMYQRVGRCMSDLILNPANALTIALGCAVQSAGMWQMCSAQCDAKPTQAWKDKAEPIILGWEDAFLAYMKGQVQTADADAGRSLSYRYLAGKSAGDVAADAVIGDLIVIIIGFFVAFVWSLIVLGRWHARWSKMLLMFGGCFLLILAIAAALGLAAAIGVELSVQIIQVLPFLVIGLGLTDMFVMMYTFRFNTSLSIPQMASNTLQETGASHAMISGTSVLVFGIASTLDFPMIRTFCHASLLAIVITYLVVLFGFLPLLVLDSRRIAAHRSDCLPCMSAKRTDESIEPRDRLQIGKKTSRFLAMAPVKAAVLVGFAALLVMSALNIRVIGSVTAALPANQFVPESSYVSGFLGDLDKYYGEFPHSFVTGLDRDGNWVQMQYETQIYDIIRVQQQMTREVDGIDLEYNFTTGWAEQYWRWANANNNNTFGADCQGFDCTNLVDTRDCFTDLFPGGQRTCRPVAAKFYQPNSGIRCWLAGSGATSVGQFNFSATTGLIHSTNMGFLAKSMFGADKFFKFIRQTRAITDASGLPVFANGWAFSLYEMNQTTKEVTGPLLGWLVLGVGLTMCFFVMHPGAMLIALTHIVMLVVEVYGLMSTMDIALNPVSLSNLIMGTYVGVLLTCYVTRSFMRTAASTDATSTANGKCMEFASAGQQERATSAFLAVAPPVFHGALGIFLCVVSLAFAKLPYFGTYFFGMYVLIVFIGIGNGLVLLPVVLSLVGPAATGTAAAQHEQTKVGKYTPNGGDDKETNGHHATKANGGHGNDQVVELGAAEAGADA